MKERKLPQFKRQNRRMARVKDNWRKPHGIDNKQRIQLGGTGALPKIGYRTSKKNRYLHPCGLAEKLVHKLQDLAACKGLAVRIGSTVGERKRKLIRAEAKKLQLKVLN